MVKMTKFMLSKYISLLNQASELFECRIIYSVNKGYTVDLPVGFMNSDQIYLF